jgi:hypothetical protein
MKYRLLTRQCTATPAGGFDRLPPSRVREGAVSKH